MRDTHDGMIEILDANLNEGVYSSLVECLINSELLKLKFSIIASDYQRLKKILQFRPFENTGIAPYRYFFTLRYRKDVDNKDLAFFNIRVEQLDKHKQFEFCISQKYIANLLWINTIHDKKQIENLIQK